ncbi:MAG: RpiB/LacA/LacB family sugar-phosphate isomerase [bacterium]|nr:RpiB/LacA/LacB family sugar-phosphate isomerase [bacterium]
MKIYIGTDHAGFELKQELKKYLEELGLGYEVLDKGPFAYDANDDYPDFIKPVAEAVAEDAESFGVILGGTGTGEAICANRTPGVRAMVFYSEALPRAAIDIKGEKSSDPYEIIKLARVHNNANIISLSARFLSVDQIKFAIELFIKTPFLNEERHQRRIKKLG